LGKIGDILDLDKDALAGVQTAYKFLAGFVALVHKLFQILVFLVFLTVDLGVFEIVAHLLLELKRLLVFFLLNLSRNVKVFLKF
jgi:hypothetical protein